MKKEEDALHDFTTTMHRSPRLQHGDPNLHPVTYNRTATARIGLKRIRTTTTAYDSNWHGKNQHRDSVDTGHDPTSDQNWPEAEKDDNRRRPLHHVHPAEVWPSQWDVDTNMPLYTWNRMRHLSSSRCNTG